MIVIVENMESALTEKLRLLHLQHGNTVILAEACIVESNTSLQKLKSFILKRKFLSDTEEIAFFKYHKPLFLSKLIYYTDVMRIETRKPNGGEKMTRKYFQTELAKLKTFFEENIDFYAYYRSNSTHLDPQYFLRNRLDYRLGLDPLVFGADPRFSTSHDYKVAKIISNDLLEAYLNAELHKLNHNTGCHAALSPAPGSLVWSDHKTALIEIIYALYYKGSFNNGNADIKEISHYFETMFCVDLGDVYRSFLEIKNRTARTKFLTSLEEVLQRKMEEKDA